MDLVIIDLNSIDILPLHACTFQTMESGWKMVDRSGKSQEIKIFEAMQPPRSIS